MLTADAYKLFMIIQTIRSNGLLALRCSTDTPQAELAQKTAKFNWVCHKESL